MAVDWCYIFCLLRSLSWFITCFRWGTSSSIFLKWCMVWIISGHIWLIIWVWNYRLEIIFLQNCEDIVISFKLPLFLHFHDYVLLGRFLFIHCVGTWLALSYFSSKKIFLITSLHPFSLELLSLEFDLQDWSSDFVVVLLSITLSFCFTFETFFNFKFFIFSWVFHFAIIILISKTIHWMFFLLILSSFYEYR